MWLLFLAAIFAPNELAFLLLAFRDATPEALAHVLWAVSVVGAISLIFAVFAMSMSMERLGYVNFVDAAINDRLRALLEVPAEGHVRVTVEERKAAGADE
ncbi:MAG: hypothetical protein U5N53_00635 [Mycobacterium sp.]|nr:hypothetical protein [Mycobacterium sp.]